MQFKFSVFGLHALSSVVFVALVLMVVVSFSTTSAAQAQGYWEWMGGDPTGATTAPTYGTEYQFAPGNWPGFRDHAISWTDNTGRLWLFGGAGSPGVSTDSSVWLNDLWVFDPTAGTHGEWAWMGGKKYGACPHTKFSGCAGVYGIEYTFGGGNVPGSRAGAVQWVDSAGKLWLFGGRGVDSAGHLGDLNDLWVFDTTVGTHGQWEWVGGSKTLTCNATVGCGTYGSYGTEYQFDPANAPAGRLYASSWTDSSGRFWIYGGKGLTSGTVTAATLPDFWVFDPAQGTHGEWAWMGGNIQGNNLANYGTEYQFADANTPSPRQGAAGWTDSAGKLWLFGGMGWDSMNHPAYMNDLWAFDPSQGAHGQWAWMGGPKIVSTIAIPQTLNNPGLWVQPSVFGTKFQFADGNMPGGRWAPFSWKDSKGRFWIDGGVGIDQYKHWEDADEFWVFDPALGAHGQWAWMTGIKTPTCQSGSCTDRPPVLGTEYSVAPANEPGGRTAGSAAWTDKNGNLWLLGGLLNSQSSSASVADTTDLWKYRFRVAQTISFSKPAVSFTYGDAPVTLTATASSGLPVSFALTSGPGSLSGTNNSTLAFTGGGVAVVVSASQSGNLLYLPAPNVKVTIPVYKHGLALQADNKSMLYGSAVPALTWTPIGFVNGDTAATALTGAPTITTSVASNWAPGDYLIGITAGTLAAANYQFYAVPGTMTVQPLGTVANPVFSLAAGNYAGTQSLQFSDASAPCTIYYTTDGSMPSETNGTKYTGAISVSASETVAAIATKAGYTPSAVVAAAYTVNAPPMVSISVSPGTAYVRLGSSQQLKVTASYSDGSSADVTPQASWSSTDSSVASITSAGVVTGVSLASTNITATVGAFNAQAHVAVSPKAKGSVLTYHYDIARDGANTTEKILTPANVNQAQFGKHYSFPVDGQIYTQPLYVSGLTIGGSSHNVVFVATENDTVYAFDADGGQAAPLWSVNLGTPLSTTGTDGIAPKVGITSTPVIDLATSTMYVLAVNTQSQYRYQLHALDLATGAEKLGGPVEVTAFVNGIGTDSKGGVVTLQKVCYQRAALVLANGKVYIPFAHCNHGWILAYDAVTLQQNAVFNTTPDGAGGDPWMSGGGGAVDSAGEIYWMTGTDFGSMQPGFNDAFLKMSPSLAVDDYFMPSNNDYLIQHDRDLGSGALVLMPDNASSTPHEVIGGGKDGRIFVINRDHLGEFQPVDDVIQVVQEGSASHSNIFSTPAYWNGQFYLHSNLDVVRAYGWSSTTGLLTSSSVSNGATVFGTHGATPIISANGTTDGILWEVDATNYYTNGPAVLHAYDATDLSKELYNSSQAGSRDTAGAAIKFTPPIAVDGLVFVPTANELDVYGLF